MLQDLAEYKIELWKIVTVALVTMALSHSFCCSSNKNKPATCPMAGKMAPKLPVKEEIKESAKVVPEVKESSEVVKTETKNEEEEEDENEDEDSDDDDDDDEPDYLFYDGPYPIVDEYTREDRPFKMVLCVNNELKMGKGKIAAQCGHATLAAYKIARKHCKTGLSLWQRTGVAKVVVKVDKEQEFDEIYEKAKLAGIVCYIVQDAGRTQIAAGSRTVLALGPGPVHTIDQLASHLKLL